MKLDNNVKTVKVSECVLQLKNNLEYARQILQKESLEPKDCYDLASVGKAICFLAGNITGICEAFENEI